MAKAKQPAEERLEPVSPIRYVGPDGVVWEPRHYELDSMESVRQMVADALYSRTEGTITPELYKDIMAAANAATRALQSQQRNSVNAGILHGLAAPQPTEKVERREAPGVTPEGPPAVQ